MALFLAGSPVALTVGSYAMHLVTRSAGIDTIVALDVGDEVSVSTWFQTLLFLASALVLLSIDEAVSLHERAGSALRELLDTGGVLYYIWVLPALAFVALVSAVQFRWWTAFPSRTRMWLGLAEVIFVAGAAEEFMEMVGLSIFVRAILDHLRGHVTELRVART